MTTTPNHHWLWKPHTRLQLTWIFLPLHSSSSLFGSWFWNAFIWKGLWTIKQQSIPLISKTVSSSQLDFWVNHAGTWARTSEPVKNLWMTLYTALSLSLWLWATSAMKHLGTGDYFFFLCNVKLWSKHHSDEKKGDDGFQEDVEDKLNWAWGRVCVEEREKNEVKRLLGRSGVVPLKRGKCSIVDLFPLWYL